MSNVVRRIVPQRPKAAPPPPPEVEEEIEQQEVAVAEEEQEVARRVRSRQRSRSRGGRRPNLMAPGVVAGETGRDVLQTNLGAGRNPRGR